MTLLLTRSDILELLDLPTALDAIRHGFTQTAAIEPLRIRTDLPGPGTATALLPGLIPGIPAYTVKVNAKFPGATPALRGLICLHDLTTGELLAVMDSATVTAWRTGLAAALATDLLANPTASKVGVIGAGAQSELTLRGLRTLRTVSELIAYDTSPERATAFTKHTAVTPQEVADRAEIIILATWSRTPLLTATDLHSGQHLTTLGADEPGKIELSADLLQQSRVIVDDAALATAMGAIGNAGLTATNIHATLTEVLTAKHPGREEANQVTVYAPVGLPWQDLALAWPIYQAAPASTRRIDFLS